MSLFFILYLLLGIGKPYERTHARHGEQTKLRSGQQANRDRLCSMELKHVCMVQLKRIN